MLSRSNLRPWADLMSLAGNWAVRRTSHFVLELAARSRIMAASEGRKLPGKAMKAFSIAVTIVCLLALPVFQSASAQDIDPRCGEMRDKVACTCALQNGGRIIRSAEPRKQGWSLFRHEDRQASPPPDSARISFPAKFRRKGWRLVPSPALAGYLACMHRHGRK